ncbi:MAG TPA: alpha/beta hydrolase [Gammaproteobacteria bacterium]|jgi:pimeloyl-ACP methyl ester carboxylesterase|nr:alpha/beta hydrolase [Gammaproteobacteria bacterium]
MILNRFYSDAKIAVALLLIVLLSGCSVPAENAKQITPQYAAIQNGRLEYYRFGHGSPIVLIPGYVTDISSWDRQFLATLAAKHQLIAFNNRNVGGSHVQSDHYESQDLARDTYQLIQKLHLRKPAILGISMGGMIAQQLAVRYPNKIGQLILINTAIAGRQSVRPSPATEKMMLDMPTSKLGRYMIALKLFFPASQRTQMGFALALNRFQPENYTEIDPAAVISQQRFLVLQWTKDNATAKKLSRLNIPVLILNGIADSVIPPINSVILADTIPHAKLIRWQDGGHAMIYQYPKSIANAVNDFIAKSSVTNSTAS